MAFVKLFSRMACIINYIVFSALTKRTVSFPFPFFSPNFFPARMHERARANILRKKETALKVNNSSVELQTLYYGRIYVFVVYKNSKLFGR